MHDKVIFETKGRLVADDRKKLIRVKESHPDYRIILVFERPNNKIRKGSPTTYSDWATKNGFEWMAIKAVKENPTSILNIMKKPEVGKLPEPLKKKRKS